MALVEIYFVKLDYLAEMLYYRDEMKILTIMIAEQNNFVVCSDSSEGEINSARHKRLHPESGGYWQLRGF